MGMGVDHVPLQQQSATWATLSHSLSKPSFIFSM